MSRCEEAVSSESAGGGDLMRRVDRLEASLGAAIEGRLEERVGAIERLIGPEAGGAAEQHLPVTEVVAAVSLADAGLDTGRPAAPEPTMGGVASLRHTDSTPQPPLHCVAVHAPRVCFERVFLDQSYAPSLVSEHGCREKSSEGGPEGDGVAPLPTSDGRSRRGPHDRVLGLPVIPDQASHHRQRR